jgi:hypothetical protein
MLWIVQTMQFQMVESLMNKYGNGYRGNQLCHHLRYFPTEAEGKKKKLGIFILGKIQPGIS